MFIEHMYRNFGSISRFIFELNEAPHTTSGGSSNKAGDKPKDDVAYWINRGISCLDGKCSEPEKEIPASTVADKAKANALSHLQYSVSTPESNDAYHRPDSAVSAAESEAMKSSSMGEVIRNVLNALREDPQYADYFRAIDQLPSLTDSDAEAVFLAAFSLGGNALIDRPFDYDFYDYNNGNKIDYKAKTASLEKYTDKQIQSLIAAVAITRLALLVAPNSVETWNYLQKGDPLDYAKFNNLVSRIISDKKNGLQFVSALEPVRNGRGDLTNMGAGGSFDEFERFYNEVVSSPSLTKGPNNHFVVVQDAQGKFSLMTAEEMAEHKPEIMPE